MKEDGDAKITIEGNGIPNLIGVSFEDVAREQGIPPAELVALCGQARETLFKARELRVQPFKDAKILTSWNGLMIAALSRASAALGDVRYAERAAKAADFILNNLRRQDGRLLARYSGGEPTYLAYLDDYAYLVWRLLELHEAAFDVRYLQAAITLNQDMVELFWDCEHGGFYFTGADAEGLITRPKEIHEGATPSGNSVATMNLLKIARITGDAAMARRVEAQFAAFSDEVARYPSAHTFLLAVYLYSIGPAEEIVIAGSTSSEDLRRLIDAVHSKYLPNAVVFPNSGKAADELLHNFHHSRTRSP